MYTVYYRENDTSKDLKIETVSASSSSAARQIAEMRLRNSRIVDIREMPKELSREVPRPQERPRFPDARFIRGEFRCVDRDDGV